MPEGLTVVQHPVLDDRLAVLRDASTPHGTFRQALSEASAILSGPQMIGHLQWPTA